MCDVSMCWQTYIGFSKQNMYTINVENVIHLECDDRGVLMRMPIHFQRNMQTSTHKASAQRKRKFQTTLHQFKVQKKIFFSSQRVSRFWKISQSRLLPGSSSARFQFELISSTWNVWISMASLTHSTAANLPRLDVLFSDQLRVSSIREIRRKKN